MIGFYPKKIKSIHTGHFDSRRAYNVFSGVRGERSLWGFTGLKPIAHIVALDKGANTCSNERLFEDHHLCIFHVFSPLPLDVSIISWQGVKWQRTNSGVRQ